MANILFPEILYWKHKSFHDINDESKFMFMYTESSSPKNINGAVGIGALQEGLFSTKGDYLYYTARVNNDFCEWCRIRMSSTSSPDFTEYKLKVYYDNNMIYCSENGEYDVQYTFSNKDGEEIDAENVQISAGLDGADFTHSISIPNDVNAAYVLIDIYKLDSLVPIIDMPTFNPKLACKKIELIEGTYEYEFKPIWKIDGNLKSITDILGNTLFPSNQINWKCYINNNEYELGPDGYFSANFSYKPNINSIVFKGITNNGTEHTCEYSAIIVWDVEETGTCVASYGDINIKDVSFGTIS